MERVIDTVPTRVTLAMNDKLNAPYTQREVKIALFQMYPMKAPGPDGYPAHFFQHHWDLCGDDVTKAVLRIVEGTESAESINDTVLVLIPKVTSPTVLSQYRPISLCNVIYKIISKCLVNRPRPLLDGMISPTQSAFIPGRLISDNALIAFECIHSLSKLKDRRGDYCAYKLDLAKAYDRVDWHFLKSMLGALGFATGWINCIMACVTSVKFSMCFNGQLLESFTPSCGIGQGDPLSPYLFLFVAEALSLLSQDVCAKGTLQDFKVNRHAPGISHLLFADDFLMFSRGPLIRR